jgi:hypothetical protein
MDANQRKPDDVEVRKQCAQQWTSLKQERQTWEPHWRELSDYLLPRRSKFLSSEKTTGARRNGNIINSTATFAVRTLGAGMMSGITSPARPWFQLTLEDPEMGKAADVRAFLDDAERRVLLRMAKSNLYNSLSILYPDLAAYGTSCLYVEDDPTDVFRTYVQPIGVYCLANSDRGEVDTVYRQLVMTVKQVVNKFGLKACSQRVRDAHEKHHLQEKVTVIHAVEPNADFNPEKVGTSVMKFRSLWFEESCGDNDGFLKRSGFEEFPYMSPRWEVSAEECYGSGPGMVVLGDVKALQLLERRKAQAMDKIVDPALVAPASLEGTRVSLLPGSITYQDMLGPQSRIAPIYEINPASIAVAQEAIREHESRTRAGFFADLWLMLSESDGKMTATEVMERHQEKMLQLGPVLEQIEQDLLTPLIQRIVAIMDRRGLFPPAPEAIRNSGFRIQFTSIMAEAQQLNRSQKLDRFMGAMGNLVAVKPEVLDKIDMDKVVDEYAESFGLEGAVLRGEDAVSGIREERAKQAQQQAQIQQQMTMAQGAKTLAAADMSGDNGLTRLMGGIAGAQGTELPQ